MTHANPTPKHPPANKDDIEKLTSLMPHDIWIYNYAKAVFYARWNHFKTGIFVQPQRPPIPDTSSCISTRFYFKCFTGPYTGQRWEAPDTPESHKHIFSSIFE